jgi:hypothetical protein
MRDGSTPKGWIHPGYVQCRVPYRGKYGTYMKEYAKDDSYYASLQCGISGSTQYILFMYLMSISYTGTTTPMEDTRDLITSAVMVLTGDGGHNIREVIFGLTSSVIIIHSFIHDLQEELRIIFDNDNSLLENAKLIDLRRPTTGELTMKILTFIDRELTTIKCSSINLNTLTYTLFASIVTSCGNWETFINFFYNKTKHINIV